MAENKLFQDSSGGAAPDLSDEGLKKILGEDEGGEEAESETQEEGSEETPENEETPEEGAETSEDEVSEESKNKGESSVDDYIIPGKAKTPEAVREIHKNDQRYIRELETKLKNLKNQAADYVDIGDDGTVRPKQQELTPEQREKINERLRDKMEENPAETIYNIAFSVANEMVSPLKQQLEQARQKETLHKKVGEDNKEIAKTAEKILKENPALQKMENGADMAVKMAKGQSLDQFAKAAYQRGLKDAKKSSEEEETGATPKGGSGGKSKSGEGGGTIEEKVKKAIFNEAAQSKFKALE